MQSNAQHVGRQTAAIRIRRRCCFELRPSPRQSPTGAYDPCRATPRCSSCPRALHSLPSCSPHAPGEDDPVPLPVPLSAGTDSCSPCSLSALLTLLLTPHHLDRCAVASARLNSLVRRTPAQSRETATAAGAPMPLLLASSPRLLANALPLASLDQTCCLLARSIMRWIYPCLFFYASLEVVFPGLFFPHIQTWSPPLDVLHAAPWARVLVSPNAAPFYASCSYR